MWPFKKKKQYVPYVPQGRIGYLRKEINNIYYFVFIFEEIGQIAGRSKVRILEIDVDRDCNKTPKQCLDRLGIGDWLITSDIHWETDEQRARRLGQIPQVTYQMNIDDTQPDIIFNKPPERQMTRHNFLN